MDSAMGPFNGYGDRWLHTEDGGVVRFVLPRKGFNSHEYNPRRPSQGWSEAACFDRQHGFIVRLC